MRPRTELAIALAAFGAAVLLAYAAGRGDRGNLSTDLRTSSTATGPAGTRALAEVIERSGGRVTRWRQRLSRLPDETARAATVAVIQPRTGIGDGDVEQLLAFSADRANLLLAGPATAPVVRCLGYRFEFHVLDSARVRGAAGAAGAGVTTTLARDTIQRRRRPALDPATPCPAVAVARVDTVLASMAGEPVMLRIHRDGSPFVILLLSDASLVSNAGLRAAQVPEVAIGTLLAAGTHVIFDEYHQEGAGGSMWRVALRWSGDSPWGWVIWQLAIVGFLVFLAGAVRFGPVRRAIVRQRRSPLEHVKALATALAASNGHDVAIGALVRGLQRRLAASGGESARRTPRVARRDWTAWVTRLAERTPDPAARARAERLVAFGTPGQSDNAVREMANAVEDVWEALHR